MYAVKGDIGDNWIAYNNSECTILKRFDSRHIFDSKPLAEVAIKKALQDGFRNGFKIFKIEEV